MTTNPNSRLDRIEAILEETAQQQRANTAAITELRSATADNTRNITDNKETIDALIVAVSAMVSEADADRARTTQAIDRLTATTERLAQEAAQDRQQAAIDRQEFRAEVRRIWEYLRDRNGGSSAPA